MDAGHAARARRAGAPGPGDLHGPDRRRGAARAADARRRSPACVLGSVGLAVVAVGRGGQVTAGRAGAVPARRAVLGDRQRGLARLRRQGRAVADGLVGGRRTGAAARALAGRSTARPWSATRWRRSRGRPRLSTLYTAGLASLVGYGVFNTLLVAQPVVLGRAVGAARPGRRDGVGLAAARPAAQRRRGARGAAADRRRAGGDAAAGGRPSGGGRRRRVHRLGTISRPSGSSEIGTILKLAMPSGMPMIVMHIATPASDVADRQPPAGRPRSR